MEGLGLMDHPSQRPSLALRRLVNGFQVTQAIHVAAVLGLADLLSDGPRTSDDLAAATDSHPQALYRLLRALASVGVFREEADRSFALTELGACLRSDAPESVGGWAAFVGEPYQWQAWGALLHSVRTGENAFRHVHGMDSWTYRARHPELSASFDRAMTDLSRQVSAAVLAAYDFGRFGCIVDVGGELAPSWPPSSPNTPACAACSSTSRTSSMEPARFSRRRGWRIAARSSAAASSRRSRREVMPTSSRRSSTTGRMSPAATFYEPAARRWRTGPRCWSSSANWGDPTSIPTVEFSDLNMLVGPMGQEADARRIRHPLHSGWLPVRRLHAE